MVAEIGEVASCAMRGKIFSFMAMFPNDDKNEHSDPLLAYKSVSSPDTLYYHQVTRTRYSTTGSTLV